MENMDEKLIKELATELANYEYNELFHKLQEMTFIEAYNALKGFNLEMDDLTCNGELFGIQVRFDYNYKHINGSVYKNGEGCELGETISVWDNNFISPIIETMDIFSNEQLNKDFQNWWKECYEEGDEPIPLFHEYMQYLYDSNIITRQTFENTEYLDEYDFRKKL